LKAFSTVVQFHPRVRLLIAGGGPQLHELEALANALNVSSRVHFLGDRDDVTALFDASDAFVFPSLSEGLPVSLLEAMAMNKPVVASRIGPHEEVVEDNVSGLLVTTGDSHALASAMMRLQSEHLLRERLVAAAKTRVVHFDAIGGATALTALYTRILDHAPG
jgi:glycosyltransferase involved in cell wall biosynthesis